MFEGLASDKFLSDEEFDQRADTLRRELLDGQMAMARAKRPTILVVAGVPGAGKGRLVHRLNAWMDPRGIETNALWQHSDEEESRPYYWRFWRKLPRRGEIGIFLGAWYNRLLEAALAGDIDPLVQARRLEEINQFESLLHADGYLIVKLWLHVSREAQRQQLQGTAPQNQQNPRVAADPQRWWQAYPRATQCAEAIIAETDSEAAPWHIIAAEDHNYREASAARILIDALASECNAAPASAEPGLPLARGGSALSDVDPKAKLKKSVYREELREYQTRLEQLAWRAYTEQRSVVAVFEGWDAAGKGSAIRRVTGAIDPRLYHLEQFAAPTPEELAHHYLWRFWRNIERDGRGSLFDRSWYGRVLVERVEGFASDTEWQRAYAEINQFEAQLVEHGSIVCKFWLQITPEEQLKRFREREETPHKQYKITSEDWRNRAKWDLYAEAVEDMVAHTSTARAPWTLVAGNNKRYARIQILKTLCKAIEAAL